MERSAPLLTVVLAVAVLFPGAPSEVWALTDAVLVMTVPAATVEPTFTASLMIPDLFAGSELVVHVALPVPPTAGVEQDHPAGTVSDWNVSPAGRVSVRTTPLAVLGPLLVTVRV